MPATLLSDDLSRSNRDLIGSNFSVKEKSIWVIKKNKLYLKIYCVARQTTIR